MRDQVDSRDDEAGHKEAGRLLTQLIAVLLEEAYPQDVGEQLVLKELIRDILFEYQRGKLSWYYA